jgi:hypothetical protein
MSAATRPINDPAQLVGDADRERSIEALRGHMLEGRLTAEEFEDRVDAVHRARTRRDLEAVNRHLP